MRDIQASMLPQFAATLGDAQALRLQFNVQRRRGSTISVSFSIQPVPINHPDLLALVAALDEELEEFDGEDHAFYSQFNGLEGLKVALIAYNGTIALGCGGLKAFDDKAAEIKRMYVPPAHRREQVAARLLTALEQHAQQLGYIRCILETGVRQTAAVALYERNGYRRIANYAQYEGVDDSVCYEKVLSG